MNGDQGEIKQILKVSFDHLSPAPVKKCFAYCSIFPQDTKLEKDQLIELWMAEGFVQPDDKNERLMEEIGYDYLRILLHASLLEEVKEEKRTYYRMHDLVHDFAKSILNPKSQNWDRYIALYSSEEKAVNTIIKASATLRTLFLERSIPGNILSKFKQLHVLKLCGEDVNVLPTSIGKLIYLRLVDISGSHITTLPKSLCKLYFLQTFRIDYYMLREGFPKKMSNLISLRHLHYYDDDCRTQMPSGIGRLSCLQTLEFFNVGRQEEGRGIQELGTLKDLKGSLEIKNLELVNGEEGAKLAKLFEKPNLSRLQFEWGNEDQRSDKCDENVLEGLQPHSNLKELEILNYKGHHFPQWLMNLSSLEELRLEDCTRCRKLPALGQLPFFQRLYVTGLENIARIGLSFYGVSDEADGRSGGSGSISRQKFFPALKCLHLVNMKNLVEWKNAPEVSSTMGGEHEVEVFPMLETLFIRGCSQLNAIPTPSGFPSLKVLEIRRCQRINFLSLDPNKGQKRVVKCLEQFIVDGCDELTSLPVEMLESSTCLRELTVSNCPNLVSFPLDLQQTPLQDLIVHNCPNLISFPLDLRRAPSLMNFSLYECPKLMSEMPSGFAFLTNLRKAQIGPFSDYSIIQFDWSGLASSSTLSEVILYGMPDTESLPHHLQYLTAITSLILRGFGAIEVLPDWLGNLVSLEDLRVVNCQRLQYLPSMTAMQRLTKLRYLRIWGCPLLTQKCTPQSSTDSEWSKISHISKLDIV